MTVEAFLQGFGSSLTDVSAYSLAIAVSTESTNGLGAFALT